MQENKISTKRNLFHWHRQLGIAVSLLVIILSITGILLNHTEKLKLNSNHIKSEFLLKWYGIKKPVIKSYSVGTNFISHSNNEIYFNEILIQKEIPFITGAVLTDDFIAVASKSEIMLLTLDGKRIELLNEASGIPNDITSLGINNDKQLILKTSKALFKSNNDVTDWVKSKNKNINWSEPSALPASLENTLTNFFRGEGLTKERVILDIHSGRILGKSGPLLMDLAAILLLILSFTGVWMYVKRTWIIYNRNKLLAAASIGDAYSAADLKRGEEGIVLTVMGDEALRQRLASMGVMAGTVIATPSSSVFGDPRTYIVRGYQLCMRTTEAAMILLQTDEQTIQQLKQSSNSCSVINVEESEK